MIQLLSNFFLFDDSYYSEFPYKMQLQYCLARPENLGGVFTLFSTCPNIFMVISKRKLRLFDTSDPSFVKSGLLLCQLPYIRHGIVKLNLQHYQSSGLKRKNFNSDFFYSFPAQNSIKTEVHNY